MSVSVGELTATIKLIDQLTPVLLKISENLAKTREKTAPVKSETDKLQQTYNKLAASLDPVVARTQKYDKALETLNHALKAGIINQSTYSKHLDQAKTKLQEASTWTSRLGKDISSNLRSQLTGFIGVTAAIGGVATVLKSWGSAQIEAETSEVKLRSAVERSSKSYGFRLSQMQALAAAISNQTGLDDELLQDAEAIALKYNRIGQQVFPAVVKAAVDMSAATGQDIPASMEKAAKAVNNPLRALTLLNREGYAVPASQAAMVKSMLASNDIIGAQNEILKILQSQYGGAADAARNTMAGALRALGTTWENFLERIGEGGTTFRDVIEGMITALQFLTDNFHIMEGGVNVILKTLTQIIGAWVNATLTGFEGIAKGIKSIIDVTPFQNEKTKQLAADMVASITNIKTSTADVVEEMSKGFGEKAVNAFAKLGKASKDAHGLGTQGANEQTEAEQKLAEQLEALRKKAEEVLASARQDKVNQEALLHARKLSVDAMKLEQTVQEALAKARSAGAGATAKQRIEILQLVTATNAAKNSIAAINEAEKEATVLFAQNNKELVKQVGVLADLDNVTKSFLADLNKANAEQVSFGGEEMSRQVKEQLEAIKQIQYYLREPIRDAAVYMRETILDNVAAAVSGSKVNWKEMWNSFLELGIRAILEWLRRFILAHQAAQAQAARTAAMNAAAGGGGGGYGYLFGKGGGTKGADASILDSASSVGAMQSGSGGASAWSTYGTYAAYAFFAWVGYNIFKGFTSKRTTFGEASLGGTTAGSRKISDKLIEIINSLTKDVEAVLKQWNLAVDKLGSVTIGQTSKGVIYVKTALDPLGQVFKTMEEAVEYAKLQAIKLAEYSKTVSALIKAAIHGSKATSLEGLSSDIEFARMLETQNLPEVENRIRSLIDTLVNNFHRAMELFKGDFTQLNTAISSILTSFSTNLWSLYNNLMGIKEDPKVAWERQKAAYNAQQAIVKAQILLLIEEIKARIAAAQAHIAYLMILRGGGDFTGFSGGQGTRTGGQQNEGESGRYSNTKGGGLQDTAPDARNPGNDPQIAALLQILDNLIRALAGLPPEITGDKPKGGFGGGRGGQRDQVRDFISDKKFELAASRMGEYQRQVASITRSYDEQLKAAGKDKKLREELLVLKAEELKLLAEEKAKSTTENFREFLGLVTPFDQVRKTSESLIKDINDSPFGNARKAAMISRVLDEVEKQLNRLSREKAASLFSEMLSDMEKFGATDAQMLEARKSMAILEHGLKMEHYRTEIELLKAEGRLPAEVLANLQKAFDFLSGIDPTKFISGGGSNSPSGPNYDDPGWQWTGAGWVYTDPSIKERSDRAKDLLKKYQEAETDEFTSKLSEINRDFAEIIAALGSTPEILNAKNAALKAALEDFLAPVKDFRQSMDFEDTSTLTGEQQFYAIRDQFRKLTSGPITAKDRDELLRLSELYRNIGKDFTAGEGFRFIDQEIKNALDRFSSVITDQAQLGTITNPMSMEAPNLQRSIEAGNIAVLSEMRDQTGLLKSTDQTIASLDFRLSNPLTFKLVS